MAKHSPWGKIDVRYWSQHLFHSTFTRDGVTREVVDSCVRISRLGRREVFNLGTPNKDAAARKAQSIYLGLVAKGWEETLAEFKPKAQDPVLPEEPVRISTIGELLREVEATAGLRPSTRIIYAQALRFVAAGTEKIGDQPATNENGISILDKEGNPSSFPDLTIRPEGEICGSPHWMLCL